MMLAWLGGCNYLTGEKTFSNMQKAGSVHIAALSIGRWEDFVGFLQPHFRINPQGSIDHSLPLTSEEKTFFSNIVNIAAQIGIPSIVNVPPLGSQATVIPDKSHENSLEPDAILNYETATALYQEVNILDNYVKNAALLRGYIPYLVRLQVTVIPFARNEPYDVFVNLGMFAACKTDSDIPNWDELPANVIPLLVTDDIEMQRTHDIVSYIRQFAGSLSLIRQVFGANVGGSAQLSQMNNFLGEDQNSLYNVSLLEENTLQVRFGATPSPPTGAWLAPRNNYSTQVQNHNVSFVLLVDPDHAFNKKCETLLSPQIGRPQIIISSVASFRNTKNGEIVLSSHKTITDKTRKILHRFVHEDTKFDGEINNITIGEADKILKDADTQNESKLISDFCDIIKDNEENASYNPMERNDEINEEIIIKKLSKFQNYKYKGKYDDCFYKNFPIAGNLLTALASISVMSEFNKTVFDIPQPVQPPPLAKEQTILIQDDCKTKAIAVLPGLNGFSPGRFIASLRLPTERLPTDIYVMADSITTGIGPTNPIGKTTDVGSRSSASNVLVLQFPSLGPLLRTKGYSGACGSGFSAPGAAAVQLKGAELWLQEVSDSRWEVPPNPKSEDSCKTKRSDLCKPNKNKAECVALSSDGTDEGISDRCFPFKTIFYEKLPPPSPDKPKQPEKSAQPTAQIPAASAEACVSRAADRASSGADQACAWSQSAPYEPAGTGR